PRHRVGVDLDSGKGVCVHPAVGLCCRATQLDLDAAFHQVCDEFPVWVADADMPIDVVCLIVQSNVAGICVKDSDHLGLGLPSGNIVHDKLEVKQRSEEVAFERQRCDAEYSVDLRQLYRNIDVKHFFFSGH